MAVRKRLGEMLVEAGIIDPTQLQAALGHQRQWGGRLGQCLVEMKLASEEAIVEALAAKFGFDVAPMDRLEHYAFEQAKALVPYEYAAKNSLFPVAADTAVLVVAMSDPTNLALTDELAFRTGRRVKVTIAGERAIAAAIRAHYAESQEGGAAREAIAFDTEDDGSAVEPIYDPVGATSIEEMSRFYQAPSGGPVPAPPARGAAPAHTPVPASPAAAPTRAATAAVPAHTPVPTAPARAAPAHTPVPAAPVRAAPAHAPAAAPAHPSSPAPPSPERSRTPAELQLEDQPTGSMELKPLETPLDALDEMSAEELQPLPLEPEPLEAEPLEAEQAGLVPIPSEAAAPEAGAPEPTEQLHLSAVPSSGEPLQPAPAEEEWVEGPAPQRELTAEEQLILEELRRMAAGDDALPTMVRPSKLIATLVRVLLQKGYVTEQELLDEILKHG